MLARLKKTTGHIDILLDQFSIAGWPGNPNDVVRRQNAANAILDKFVRDFKALDPDYVIPFASFVRFSHYENASMNAAVNTVNDVAASLPAEQLVFMYPGDIWQLGDGQYAGSNTAFEKYSSDWRAIDNQPLTESETVPLAEILDAANKRIFDIQRSYHHFVLNRIPMTSFYVTDLATAVCVDVLSGAQSSDLSEEECVVSISSQAIMFTFSERFGLPTLGVSGRFSINHSENKFRKLKKLGSAYSAGFHTKGFFLFLFRRRTLEFLWRRRADFLSQFVRRIPLSNRPRPPVDIENNRGSGTGSSSGQK